MSLRDHEPVIIDEFNGWWQRGDIDSCPLDHWTDAINVQFTESGFTTRDGVGASPFQNKSNILRVYSYNSAPVGEGVVILNTSGEFWHLYNGATNAFKFLTIVTATDFARVELFERLYFSPSTRDSPNGLGSEFYYVYKGDGATAARKAGGTAPVNADGIMTAANSATVGNVSAGVHIFAIAYITDTGFITALGPDTLAVLNPATGGFKVDLATIPKSGASFVTDRWILGTKAIPTTTYNGDSRGYEFFFIQKIGDNTTTSLTIDFFDTELLDSADNLFDYFANPPAFGGLSTYHGRVIGWNPGNAIDSAYASDVGSPEAFNQVDGLIQLAASEYGITVCQEYRDVLYMFRANQTFGASDNGDIPSNWSIVTIDEGIGCGKHGVPEVGDIGQSLNQEQLILVNNAGIFQFNGLFTRPELSYKIQDYIIANFGFTPGSIHAQIAIDARVTRLYIALPDLNLILMGDYRNGLSPKSIKWTKWTFGFEPSCICLFTDPNKLLIGSRTGTDNGLYQMISGQTNDVLYVTGTVKIPNPTIVTALIGD
ncbi:MAG TPA: hypothetical protein VE971_01720 [Candidatus Eisenbacteria bacterium]|nr:hypothetical protein [Candidatus Eisenbacteria bacterium]